MLHLKQTVHFLTTGVKVIEQTLFPSHGRVRHDSCVSAHCDAVVVHSFCELFNKQENLAGVWRWSWWSSGFRVIWGSTIKQSSKTKTLSSVQQLFFQANSHPDFWDGLKFSTHKQNQNQRKPKVCSSHVPETLVYFKSNVKIHDVAAKPCEGCVFAKPCEGCVFVGQGDMSVLETNSQMGVQVQSGRGTAVCAPCTSQKERTCNEAKAEKGNKTQKRLHLVLDRSFITMSTHHANSFANRCTQVITLQHPNHWHSWHWQVCQHMQSCTHVSDRKQYSCAPEHPDQSHVLASVPPGHCQVPASELLHCHALASPSSRITASTVLQCSCLEPPGHCQVPTSELLHCKNSRIRAFYSCVRSQNGHAHPQQTCQHVDRTNHSQTLVMLPTFMASGALLWIPLASTLLAGSC